RAAHPAHAVRRGADPARDRRGPRRRPDAGEPLAQPHPLPAAQRAGGCAGGGDHAALTAAAQRTPVTPRLEVICFWKIRNSTTSGASAIVVAAITSVQLPLYWVCSAAVATVMTCHSGRGAMTSGHMKLFHWLTTVMSSSVARIGLFIGTITCHSRRITPAPSIRAASSTSDGVDRTCSRSRKIAEGEPNMNGTTSPAKLFLSPSDVIIA